MAQIHPTNGNNNWRTPVIMSEASLFSIPIIIIPKPKIIMFNTPNNTYLPLSWGEAVGVENFLSLSQTTLNAFDILDL